jgi:hypothetical protein
MQNFGKAILLIGLLLIVVGAAIWGLGKAGFRGLPGDIVYKTDNVRIYFPIVTCLVLSALLTLLLWLWQWLSK